MWHTVFNINVGYAGPRFRSSHQKVHGASNHVLLSVFIEHVDGDLSFFVWNKSKPVKTLNWRESFSGLLVGGFYIGYGVDEFLKKEFFVVLATVPCAVIVIVLELLLRLRLYCRCRVGCR